MLTTIPASGSGGRRGAAGGGAGRGLLGWLGQLGVELFAADAAVAVAVDRDPVAVAGFRRGQLVGAQVAVLVLVEAVEQRRLGIRAPGEPGEQQQGGGEHQPFEADIMNIRPE